MRLLQLVVGLLQTLEVLLELQVLLLLDLEHLVAIGGHFDQGADELPLHDLVHVGHEDLLLPVLHADDLLDVSLLLLVVVVEGHVQHQLEDVSELLRVGQTGQEHLLHPLLLPVAVVVRDHSAYALVVVGLPRLELVPEVPEVDLAQQSYYHLLRAGCWRVFVPHQSASQQSQHLNLRVAFQAGRSGTFAGLAHIIIIGEQNFQPLVR